MQDLSRVPWELLLPCDRRATILWLGGPPGLLTRLQEDWHIETSESAGPFGVVARLPEASTLVDRRSLRKLLLPDGYVIWVNGVGAECDGAGSGSGTNSESIREQRFLARGRSLWSEQATWAQPLRGAGKVQFLVALLGGSFPRLLTPSGLRHCYKVSVTLPGESGTGGWIFELIADLARRDVAGLTASGLGRIEQTENGAAIAQLLTRKGVKLALKVALQQRVAVEMVHEGECVARLLSRDTLEPMIISALPQVVESGCFQGRQYRLEKWLTGRPSLELMYKRREREQVVDRAIEWISLLHKNTLGPPRDPQHCVNWVRKVLISFSAKDRGEDREFAERVADYLEQRLNRFAIPTVFGHGDYWLGNVIHDPRSHTITGVIDWNYADEQSPPLADLLHLLFHRKWFFSIYDPGAYLSSLFKKECHRRDQKRIASYLKAVDLDPDVTAPLAILYWVRYLASRQSTLSSRHGWYERSYRQVHSVLAPRLGNELDSLGKWLASD